MASKSLSDLKSDIILAHILDPAENPLPAKLEAEYKRVVSAARLLDDYPNESHAIRLHCAKYNISKTQARTDLAHARQLFKSQHTFDWDFSFAWMVKDQLELIRSCKLRNDFKNWNAAKKVLYEMIGTKPVEVEDPRRMEKNLILVQINNIGGEQIRIPIDSIRGLSPTDLQTLQEAMTPPVSDAAAEEIFNS